MAALLLLHEGRVSGGALGTGHRAYDPSGQGESLCGRGSTASGQAGQEGSAAAAGAAPGVERLLSCAPSSPSLGPARVVNVLIAALMSCKWDPTSRYIRVMSSHLTNGDLIELLIGCLFPPRFMTPRPGLSGEGEVRGSVSPGSAPGLRLARQRFQGHRLSTFLQGKINSLRLLCLY